MFGNCLKDECYELGQSKPLLFQSVSVHTQRDEPDDMTSSPAVSDVRWVCSPIPTEPQESHFLFSRIIKLLGKVATDFSSPLQKSPPHSSSTSWYR